MIARASVGARKGAFVLLIGCFLGSAFLRTIVAFPAFAQQMDAESVDDTALAGCVPMDDPLLEAVQERGIQLDQREREMEERLALLNIAEAEIDKKRAALAEAEESLAKTLALADSAAEEDIIQLTAIYENVKPKQAVGIFATMDVNFAAGILSRMSAPKAADILALLDADKAYAISVLMAARNMNAGGPVPAAN